MARRTVIPADSGNQSESARGTARASGKADRPVLLHREAKASIRVLVVDDEATIRESCATVLEMDGYQVTACARGQEAIDLLAHRRFQIVLADQHLPVADGFAVLRAALSSNPDVLFIMITGNPSVQSSLEALEAGAWDYLPKPFSATQLQVLVGRAAHTLTIAKEAGEPAAPPSRSPRDLQRAERDLAPVDNAEAGIIGVAPSFRNIVDLSRRVATTDASVFIMGESGVGKEKIARFIHENSRRARRPFVAVNCAALPEALLESEMFGHRKGAFTDAVRDKAGLMETANGGTLFLDELLEMSRPIQAKLLRVIQDGIVRRVGSEDVDAVVNVRFIAATNRDPDAAIKDGSLREDLFYRLCVVPIHVPPLRERPEDIPLLAEYCLRAYWSRHRAPTEAPPRFTEAAIRALTEHTWAGNVRELQNVIEHAVVMLNPGAPIQPDDLPLTGDVRRPTAGTGVIFTPMSADEGYHAARERVISDFELQYLAWLVDRADGNMSKAARIAGVDRTTLYRLMERHHIYRGPSSSLLRERPSDPVGIPATPEMDASANRMASGER
ncbi:MAG TPA: sigma-54 dependent transcriptional regulator [Gemmatimonadaceae bacterium]